jgi:class 3 adenylate cyclase/pSer/pThr/pTyr-binding forkhead associated (FHA) protein
MSQEELAKLQELIKARAKLDEELGKFQRMVTLMFVDIVGSTTYFDRYGDVAGLVWVHKCIDMLIPVAEQHGGTVSKTIGDALMTYYEDPLESVRAAIDMQRALQDYNQHKVEIDQIKVRIGLNYGLGLIKDKDVFGDVVNVAARIESMAKADQIFIGSTLEEKIRSSNLQTRKLPEVSVKGKAEKLDVYEVLWKDIKGGPTVSKPAASPTIAARVPVFKASEQPTAGGTVVMGSSPVAAVAKPRVEYSLIVVRPDGSHGQACKLEKPVTILGRVEGDIVFPDDTLVSRKHARFTLADDGVVVEDLHSANGVFWRLRAPHTLADSDIVLMGRQMFRFVTAKPGAKPAAPPEKGKDAKDAKKEKDKEEKPAEAPPAELVRLLPGGVEETRYPLVAGENILGRTRGTLTFPQDAYLSSQHARIRFDSGKFIVEDMNAANGTFVAVHETKKVGDGDIILIGHQLLRVTAQQN